MGKGSSRSVDLACGLVEAQVKKRGATGRKNFQPEQIEQNREGKNCGAIAGARARQFDPSEGGGANSMLKGAIRKCVGEEIKDRAVDRKGCREIGIAVYLEKGPL